MKPVEIRDLYEAGGLYINLPAILNLGYKYTIIVSLRGGGKTYGCLKYMLENHEKMIYFRRSKPALYMAADKDLHMYRRINTDLNRDVVPQINEKTGLASFREGDELIAMAASLSTFASIRSIGSARDLGISWLVFDECIPQPDERRTYDVYSAWRHAEETLIRNDELQGETVCRRLLMANADQIYGDIVAGFGIGDELMVMQDMGMEAAEHSEDVLILRPRCDALRAAKEDTALYRTSGGSEFSSVALDNQFMIRDRGDIKKQPLHEFIPIASINGICVYRHKTRKVYYVSEKITGKPKVYERTDADRRRYLRDHMRIWKAYMARRVSFESLTAQMTFFKIYDLL